MLKLIFCNLDLLKNHFDSNDYDGVNLLTLDYKQIQKNVINLWKNLSSYRMIQRTKCIFTA